MSKVKCPQCGEVIDYPSSVFTAEQALRQHIGLMHFHGSEQVYGKREPRSQPTNKDALIRMLNQQMRYEQGAAQAYRLDASTARGYGANLTANLFETIAQEEDHHLAELRAQLARIK